MRRILPICAAAVIAATPLQVGAQKQEEGLSLMEEGAKLFLKGILQEMEPALDGLQGLTGEMGPALKQFVDEMGPGFVELLGKIDDFSAYHPPEILPNGDIIIRRKTPLEAEPEDGEEIEI